MSRDIGERRLLPVFLLISGLAVGGIALEEGYTERAVAPLKGDKPTYGFGSTTRPDGTPVQTGDRISPPAALRLSINQLAIKEQALRQCVTAPMTQYEWDAMVSLAYNVGEAAVCRSRLVERTNAGDYAGACEEYLRWRYFQGRDCALPENRCRGLWLRRQADAARCRGENK